MMSYSQVISGKISQIHGNQSPPTSDGISNDEITPRLQDPMDLEQGRHVLAMLRLARRKEGGFQFQSRLFEVRNNDMELS